MKTLAVKLESEALIVSPLPPRIAVPLVKLFDQGCLTELEYALTVRLCETSDQPARGLALAVVVKHLLAGGIPLADTLDMAAACSRRINTSWSMKRWHEEHGRLSRLMTVRAFSAENRRYDIAPFLALLPDTGWKGYVIPTRRRLAMEGQRQRHCIAAYDQRLLGDNHRVAVASVFHAGYRWTVLLALQEDGSGIVLRDMKGCLDRRPTAEQKAHVVASMKL